MLTSPSQDQALAWAREAAACYPLHDPILRFLGHSDNITFRVEEPDGTIFLLRLHQPVLRSWVGIRQVPEVIASELTWLEALAGGDFTVQQPIRTLDGGLVASINIGEREGEAKTLPATLLSWLEGEHFSPSAPGAGDLVERFGALVARLHDFSTRWTPPAGLIRPQYDYDHFNRTFAHLLRGVDLGVFSEDVYWILRAACQAILAEIERLPNDVDHWGMVHADLHVGNFLVNGSQIIPIDFSFCGFGHYLFDLSVCLAGGLNQSLRPIFLQGYRSVRTLPESAFRAVDAYVLAGRLSYYAYQVSNPAERGWLQRRIPEVAQRDCVRFLQGETIFWNV